MQVRTGICSIQRSIFNLSNIVPLCDGLSLPSWLRPATSASPFCVRSCVIQIFSVFRRFGRIWLLGRRITRLGIAALSIISALTFLLPRIFDLRGLSLTTLLGREEVDQSLQ